MSCCQLSLCLHGHRCAHNAGSSSKGRMNLLIIFVGQGDWWEKGGIWVTSSIERGHKKTCRLQNHQDPDLKRLGCIASMQVKTDGVLWAAVIIIADAEDCWDELIDLWVHAVCPSDMVHRRKADPSKMGCGYGGTNTVFSSLHAPVCCGKDKKSVALWAPWFWGARSGAFMHFLQWGVQATISSQICPQDHSQPLVTLSPCFSWLFCPAWSVLMAGLSLGAGIVLGATRRDWTSSTPAGVTWCQCLGFLLTKLSSLWDPSPFIKSVRCPEHPLLWGMLSVAPRSVEHRYPLVAKPQAFLGKKIYDFTTNLTSVFLLDENLCIIFNLQQCFFK